MAKLNPPGISGTLPSFHSKNGTVTLTVPFFMNQTVSAVDVNGFSLRVKSTTTDSILGIFDFYGDSLQNRSAVQQDIIPSQEVSFDITSIKSKLIVGQYYKIQIAYIRVGDVDLYAKGEIGYYSSLGIAKYTSQPTVSISGMTSGGNFNTGSYTGVYYNNDTSEKAYSYKFTVFDDKGFEIESTGWQLHNSYSDEKSNESIDTYIIKTALEEGARYKIQYAVITNNNLEIKSPKYTIIESESIDPAISAELISTLDYNNACITIGMKGQVDTGNGKEKPVSGTFILSRASSDTGFNIWTVVHDFKLQGQLPSSFLFRDFAIEHGTTYRYALQQYNKANIYSRRLYSTDVIAEFEDAYLYDGTKQLRIRFNTKVSSFKTNYLDSKKTTLGSQYPFIFRNGAVAYKEFPINGLLSYALDNDQFFISYENDLLMPKSWEFTTDIIDKNITYERRFKLAVMDWLNNGDIKLFKSPTEGNYLVRLMNVNLSPVDQTSRMLHNFSCTANEVAAYTIDNLSTYKFLNVETVETGAMRWSSIVLSDFVEPYYAQDKVADIRNYDLLNGLKCYHIQITDAMPGTQIELGDSADPSKRLNIVIGVTGSYEAKFEVPFRGLYLKSSIRKMPGIITFGVYSTTTNKFDSIQQLTVYDIPLLYVQGPNEDIFADYVDTKHVISKVFFARFSAREVIPVNNRQTLEYYLLDGSNQKLDILSVNTIYFVQSEQKYYQFTQWSNVFDQAFQELPNYSTEIRLDGTVLNTIHDNEVYVPELTSPPQHISIDSGVLAEIAFQIKEITYAVEANFETEKKAYLNALETWRGYAMHLEPVTASKKSKITEKDDWGFKYAAYYFVNNQFIDLTEQERYEYNPNLKTAWTVRVDNQGQPSEWNLSTINQKHADYLEAKETFMTLLDEALAEQEVELSK